jgi:hypothetical protein
MKTQGEIEAAICDGINRFQQDYMETARDLMEAMVLEVTAVKVLRLHHDIRSGGGRGTCALCAAFCLATPPSSSTIPNTHIPLLPAKEACHVSDAIHHRRARAESFHRARDPRRCSAGSSGGRKEPAIP